MNRLSWKIAFAYIGVIVGAGLSSGQDLLQYFLCFGKTGPAGRSDPGCFECLLWENHAFLWLLLQS